VEQDDKGWDARKRAYCLKIQPATGSFARNLIYSTKPMRSTNDTIRYDTIRRWYTVAKAYKRKLKRFIPAWNSGSYRGLKAMQVSNGLN
ncbi:hypothetical protein ACSJM9_26375, partial [Klebsiella pneumoniae]|uniref:hypothetical protein n=1 Tax=Klebsiella pneumoniae TaxID=573 RepID=UPI003EDF43FB